MRLSDEYAARLAETDALTCELQEGGLVFDTAGFDVTIAHAIVTADGVTGARVVKKGEGRLAFTGDIAPDGGFEVEAGTLAFTNLKCAKVDQIVIAADAGLDLDGGIVATSDYVLNGVKQGPGEYPAPNGTGTIRVPNRGTLLLIR